MVPSGLALAVLGGPIVRILFQRGEFTAYSTAITGGALFFYAFGLLAYGGTKLLVTAFYAMHDTRTPVKTAFIAVIVNIIFNLILMWPMKLSGLALATSISAVVNFLMLYILLGKKIGDFGTRAIADSFLRVLAASLVMAAILKILSVALVRSGVVGLCASLAIGSATYIMGSYVFGVKEMKDFSEWILRRR